MPRKGLSEAGKTAKALQHRPAKPRPPHTKDRSWEEAQRTAEYTTQVSYRGISRALNEEMKKIAKEHGRNVSQVAASFLGYAWFMHARGVSLAEMDTHRGPDEHSASG